MISDQERRAYRALAIQAARETETPEGTEIPISALAAAIQILADDNLALIAEIRASRREGEAG